TLKMSQARPEAVFAEIAKQTGYSIVPRDANLWQRVALPAISVDFVDKPFWHAVHEVCRQANIGIDQAQRGDRSIGLCAPNEGGFPIGVYPISAGGPLLIAPISINRNSSVDLSRPGEVRRNSSLQLLVLVEPRLKVLKFGSSAEADEVIGADGKSVPV